MFQQSVFVLKYESVIMPLFCNELGVKTLLNPSFLL